MVGTAAGTVGRETSPVAAVLFTGGDGSSLSTIASNVGELGAATFTVSLN